MTKKIRGRVFRMTDPRITEWFVTVYVYDEAGRIVGGGARHRYTRSWPEAMQSAYKLIADLDAELMDAVHASRSRRRAIKENAR